MTKSIACFLTFALLACCATGQTELPIETRVIGISDYASFPGCGRICLTFDGKHALVLRERGKASLFDVESLEETNLKVDPHCVGIRSNCQEEGYFAFTVVEDAKIEQLSQWKRGTSFGHGGEILYFSSLDRLKEWMPSWKLHVPNAGGILFFQIPGSKLFALITAHKKFENKREVVLIDPTGVIMGKFEVNGSVIGLEQSDDLEIYFAGETASPYEIAVLKAQINKRYKIPQIKTLYVLELGDYCRQWNYKSAFPLLSTGANHDQSNGPQMFRTRGCRPGDVMRFVSDILPQTGYFPIGPFARDLPYKNSRLAFHLRNLNQVAAFESATNFELMQFETRTPVHENEPSLWNRQGDIAYIGDKPTDQPVQAFYIYDAVLDSAGGVVVHSKVLNSEEANQGRMSIRHELGISYFGNRIPKAAAVSK